VNTSKFLTKAGTTIFCLSVILWAMTYYPRLPRADVKRVTVAAQEAWPSNAFNASANWFIYATDEEREAEKKEFIQKAVDSANLRQSIAGKIGHAIEPAIKPLGYDWKMGIGLVGAFAAREVFVSTMAITYGAGDADNTQSLSTALRNDRYANGRPVWTPLVAVSLLVWFVLAMQCMSTLAIVRRETGGWRWPLFMLAYMNGLAYVVSLLIYQIGSRLI
jgi:ferrous iron transport protein B